MVGAEVDATPAPGPNKTPINHPALINVSGGAFNVGANFGNPGYHTANCSGPGSLIQPHSISHTVAVDTITNQVFVVTTTSSIGTSGTNNQIIGSFPGWQPGGNEASMFPIDPQYPPSVKGVGSPPDCTPVAPCVGQQATPTQNDSFTNLCSRGTDILGTTGSDANGCILVLQDGP